MKEIKTYITEKLKVTKYYTLFPKSSDELKQMIKDEISKNGVNCSLNHIAVEPMLNLGTRQVFMLDDDWTIVTGDNKPSAHFEHTVVVTKDGYQILTGDDKYE